MALKRHLKQRRENPQGGDPLPDVIAVQDPHTIQVFRSLQGYKPSYRSKGTFTEEDNPTRRRGAPSVPEANPIPTEHVLPEREKPELHKVFFHVHSSIPTTDWRVVQPEGPNETLVATLELAIASGTFRIHNVYNHLQRLDVGELVAMVGGDGDRMLVGDFNFHHPDWSNHNRGRTAAGDLFARSIEGMNLELVTEQGAITFSNSTDTTKRSSTLDLTFVSERIRPAVAFCEPIEPPGFESDHRIIETLIGLRINREYKVRRCWHKTTPDRFQRELDAHLPPKDYPIESEQDIDNYFIRVDGSLIKTMDICVPLEACGRRRNKPTVLDQIQHTIARLEDLQKRSQMPENEQDVSPEEEIRRRIRKLEQKSWQLFTERRSNTPRKAYNLAKLARRLNQPQEACHVPPLLHDGEYHHDDKGKVETFVKVIFRANDDSRSKVVPDHPRPRPADGRPKLDISQDLEDEEL